MKSIYEKLQYYIQIYCVYRTMGPQVKIPKALKENNPMWVYEVGLVPRFQSLKTRGWGCIPKRHEIGPTLRYESQKTRDMTCP